MREWTIGKEGDQVTFNGSSHPIRVLEQFSPTPDYSIEVHEFTDELKGRLDTGTLELKPYGSTRTQHVVGQVDFIDRVVRGSGVFLAVNPEGKIVRLPISYKDSNTEVFYGREWTITWIAGKYGLEVFQVCSPAFKPDMEEEVKPGSNEAGQTLIPSEYWRKYEGAKRRPLYGPAAYRVHIGNIVKRLERGTRIVKKHSKDQVPISHEVPLSPHKRDLLWDSLLRLADLNSYRIVTADDLLSLAKRQFSDAKGSAEGSQDREREAYRIESLRRLFREKRLISEEA